MSNKSVATNKITKLIIMVAAVLVAVGIAIGTSGLGSGLVAFLSGGQQTAERKSDPPASSAVSDSLGGQPTSAAVQRPAGRVPFGLNSYEPSQATADMLARTTKQVSPTFDEAYKAGETVDLVAEDPAGPQRFIPDGEIRTRAQQGELDRDQKESRETRVEPKKINPDDLKQTGDRKPIISKLTKSGNSFDGDLRTLPYRPPVHKERPEREDPEMERRSVGPPSPLDSGKSSSRPDVVTAAAPPPSVVFEGLDRFNWGAGSPPDTNGDVGPNHYIQTVNTSIGIYSKAGGLPLAAFTFDTLMSQGSFGNQCDTENFGDPVVLYDTFEDRWIITDFAFTLDGGGNVNPPIAFQCFAASKTPDPVAGGWNFYSIQVTDGLNDYPKFGIWPDGLYMSSNMFGYAAGAAFITSRVWAFNKAQMYAGSPTVQVVSFNVGGGDFTVIPSNARLQTGTPPAGRPNLFQSTQLFLNALTVYKFHADWNSISLSTFTGPDIPISATSWPTFAAGVPQSGTATLLDSLSNRAMVQNQYVNFGGTESLWVSHTVRRGNATGFAAPRWYQVNVTGGTVNPSIPQAATWDPDGANVVHRWMPSVALDRGGNMAMGYSTSNSTTFPSIKYAGRLAGDPINTFSQTEQTMFTGTASQTTSTRWGDYSAMTLDPDGCTFWYTSEYANPASQAANMRWLTKIGAFSYASIGQCTPFGAGGTVTGTVTVTPGGTPISGATITFGARSTTTNGSGVYSFLNIPAGTYPSISATKPGYSTAGASNIVVTDGGTTTQDFALTVAPTSACLTDTTQADFLLGVPTNVDLATSPGDVTLLPYVDQNTAGTTTGTGFGTPAWTGQTFTPAGTGQLVKAEVQLFCNGCGATPPNLTLSVRNTAAGLPTGADLASVSIPGSAFASGLTTTFMATFGAPASVTSGTQYALILRPVAVPAGSGYFWIRSSPSTYAGGSRVLSADSGGTWSSDTTRDYNFKAVIQGAYTPLSGNLISSTKDSNPAAGLTPIWSTLSWNGATPANTTLQFQVAGSNNPGGPFSFIGPDGTAGTFYTTSPGSLTPLYNLRYAKYKAYLATTNSAATPVVNDVTMCFNDVDCSTTVATITPTPATVSPNSTGNTASGPAGMTSYSWSITNGTITSATNIPTITYTAGASGNVGLTLNIVSPNGCQKSNSVNVPIVAADLDITKTDGVTTATPGGSVTYTITASNLGPNANPAASVADTFPASLTCTWTSSGAGGGAGTASGSGNINDTANLPVGGSVTYTASCSISASATGSLSNTATVSGGAISDPNGANNSATDTDTLVASADLSITKTDGVTTATPGGSTTYTITASNAGPSNTTATVADTFPASLTVTWTCAGAGGGTCTAAGAGNINDAVTLPAGGSVTYTASAAISAAATGTLSNTATVTGAATDPVPGNNSATDTDTLTQQADLAITKTDGVTTATPGGSVTYTITASNAGPSNAPGATVADTFPASLTGNWTCVGAGGGTCTAAGSGNINDTVNLPAGGSVTYTATKTISAAATGTLSNTATVTAPGGVTDPTPGNNSATDSDTLAASADLAITKTDGVTTATPGGSVTYTITASNAGPSNAPGATVADTFPASLTGNWTCVGAGGGTCTAAGSGNINDTVNLPAGGSVTYTATKTISAAATGTLSNTATVTAPGGVTDPTPGNNSATDSDTLAASADLAITKTDGVTTATPGGSVTYTITASNAGPSNAPGATVADTFPASLTGNWTCVGAGGGTCTAAGSGNINDTVNLPAGGSVTYTATKTISAAATGTLSNTATVTAPGGVTDPTPGNNSATDSDTLAASADLAITKTDGVTTATPGGSVTYTIVASNAGPSNATSANVADTFPAAITSDNWTCAGAGGGTCTASGSGNISQSVNLPAGGSVTFTVVANISGAATGTVSNTATVTAPGGVTDPTPGNNSATDTDTVVSQADLAITKTDGVATAVPGGSVTYTITASNAGPSNAPGSNVSDTFPAAITGVNWTCVGAGGGTCTASGSGSINQTVNLPAGGSVTFTAVAAISPAATGTLSNTATTATGGGVTDPTPGNNTATDTDTLTPQANLGITKTNGVTSVSPGGSTTYTITASNAGPSNAPGTTVGDIFPAILTCTTTSVAAGGATGNAAGPFGGNINNTLNMPVGSSVTYTSVCNISGAASGTLTNTATVTAAVGVTDPTPGNNTATDADIIVVPPTISKNFTSPTIVFGEVTSLNIIVGNPATNVVNLTGVSFTDTLPAGITVPNLGPIALCGGSYSATAPNTVTMTGVTITPGATCTATVAVTGVQIGPWTNTINSVSSTNGGTNNTPASAIITVNKASTTASVISDTPDPSVFGQNYTVGAQVIVTAPGSPTPTAPTGTITVTDGTNNCTITLSAASCLLPSTSVGAKTLTATYNGDGNFNASLASPGVPHTVNKANTATVVTSSANPSAFGQNVGFTATVSAAAPGAGTPTGTVTFAIDGVNQPPATLSGGSVTMNTSTLSVGTHTITAQYNGDANFNTSNGALAGGQVVGKANTTTVITNAAALASTASNSGQPYAVNFTVTPAVPGAGTPTGFVSVTDGTDICLGTVASGTCNLTSTTAGVKTITATYLGDPNFNSSSGTATHTVLASISGNIQQFVPPVANLAPEATTPLAGVTVSITGTAPLPASTTTDANGNYSFGGLTLGGNYTVTPTMAGKSFEPLSRSYTNVTANVTGADFVAYAPAVPREIKALNAYALQGQPAVMQLVLTGLGNEKTESFSLNFNINELSAPTVACGTSDAGCTIATDTSQPGKIGITVTPATQLAAGPRNIANVTFQTFASEPPNSPVTFGGAPTPQSITDAVGNPLQTAYTGAFAVFAKGFEGDVAPRPNGSGETDSSDIVGVSRFVAGLDNPVLLNTNEFQRADASPNGLKGDGKIDSTDIVQTTRYGAGLDGGTHVIVAGPMQALPLPPALTRAERSDEDREIARAKRTMRVGSVTAAPGSDVEVSVELDSRGDEVASSFTLNFDPARLRISGLSSPEANPDVAVGRDAPAGTGLAVNATNAARGQIGIVVFNANLIPFSNATGRKVVTLHFRIAEDAPTGPSPITFGDTDDSPTQRSLSDGNANPLKSTYTDGEVKIVGRNPAGVSGRGFVSILDGSSFNNPSGGSMVTAFLLNAVASSRKTDLPVTIGQM